MCCGEQPTHLFVYENGTIWTICETHFKSTAHRYLVNKVLDLKTGKRVVFPKKELNLEDLV